MGFSSGSMSFRRFAVIGEAPASADSDLLEKLEEHALREQELGLPEEVEYGWCGGRHVLDTSFSFEHNVFVDSLSCAMRIDTNKVPGDLKKAYQIMEEEAIATTNPSGFISKNQKRDVKDIVRRKVDDDLRSGKFRRSKMSPLLWDFSASTVYCNAGSAVQEKVLELFERTFELKLLPLSAGSIALRALEKQGRRRDYEDCRPTRFAIGPEGDYQQPDYPWVAKGPEAKDFLGNEFLLWLWHEADVNGGAVLLDAGADVNLLIDRSLDLDCAFGATGKDVLKGTGPARMPEALDALRSGKMPRKAGLVMEMSRMAYNLSFNAETFGIAGLVLPEVEDAESPRVLFEERIAMLRDFSKMIDVTYDAFLKVRMSGGWERMTSNIRKWIAQTAKSVQSFAAAG